MGSLMVLVVHDGVMHVLLSLVASYASYDHPATSKSSSMCTSSSLHSMYHNDLSVYLFLQFTYDGMTPNPKHPTLE